jgi:hypothetical protein
MTKRLIINADDYGRTQGVSEGIRSAHLNGIVTSTTAMMNMPGIEAALEKAQRDCPKLGIGVHLVLTAGKPLLPPSTVSTLTGGGDHFPTATGFVDILPGLDTDQVRSEWEAQVQKFIRLTGKKPDHLDSHHHTSYFTTHLFENMLEMAIDLDCAIRPPLADGNSDLPMDLPSELSQQATDFLPQLLERFNPRAPENFYSNFYDETATMETIIQILGDLQDGTSEMMCHPGIADKELISGSIYNIQRENELNLLKDPSIRSLIFKQDVQLINYSRL